MSGVRLRYSSITADSGANARGLARFHAKPTANGAGSAGAGQRRDLAAEIAGGTVDALAEREAHEAGDCDRSANLCFRLFKGLRHAGLILLVKNEGLIEQANFLVVGLEAGLDDLLDDVCWFALGLGRKHIFLALDRCRIETGRIDGLGVGEGNMHRHHAAESLELLGIARRFEPDDHAD